MLIKCPECGKKISDRVEACPYCGAPQPASLRSAALQQRKLARRKAIRITATALAGAILLAAVASAALYRWPVSYSVGTVTETDIISRDDLVKAIDDAAAAWNRAAGRVVAWRLPLGERVRFDVEIDAKLQEHLTTLEGLQIRENASNRDWSLAKQALGKVREAYSWSLENPTYNWASWIHPGESQAVKWWRTTWKRRPTLDDVKKYDQAESAAGREWSSAHESVEAFKKTAQHDDDPSRIDAGVIFTKGSPIIVLITGHASQFSWTKVLTWELGRVLLGDDFAYGYGTDFLQAASPLKSPWKTRLFNKTGR